MKKLVFFVILVLFVCSLNLFSGGGQSSSSVISAPGGPARLTVAINQNLRIENYKTNAQTRIIERGANVDLEFVEFPTSDYVQRINLMIMAGGTDLPDVLIGVDGARFQERDVYRWANEGAVLPLTRYFRDPNATVNLRAAMQKNDYNVIPLITMPDGEIYFIPYVNLSTANENQPKVWYYSPWMDKLRLSVPTTTDEFRDVLRAVVKNDPNGNGRVDEIGMVGTFNMPDPWTYNWFQFLMNAFIYAGDSNLFVVNNGRVSAAYTDPEWREGLKYIRSLFAEGLLPI